MLAWSPRSRTWLKFRNRGDLAILAAGDPGLFNQYGVTPVNLAPHVTALEARVFID